MWLFNSKLYCIFIYQKWTWQSRAKAGSVLRWMDGWHQRVNCTRSFITFKWLFDQTLLLRQTIFDVYELDSLRSDKYLPKCMPCVVRWAETIGRPVGRKIGYTLTMNERINKPARSKFFCRKAESIVLILSTYFRYTSVHT